MNAPATNAGLTARAALLGLEGGAARLGVLSAPVDATIGHAVAGIRTAGGQYTTPIQGTEIAATIGSVFVGGPALVGGNVTRGLSAKSVVSQARAEAFLIKNGISAEKAADYISSFDGPITARIMRQGEVSLRYTGNPNSTGNFLTKTLFDSPASAIDGLYLAPYGNSANYLQSVTALRSNIVFEGAVKNGAPQVDQILIHTQGAFKFNTGQGY